METALFLPDQELKKALILPPSSFPSGVGEGRKVRVCYLKKPSPLLSHPPEEEVGAGTVLQNGEGILGSYPVFPPSSSHDQERRNGSDLNPF